MTRRKNDYYPTPTPLTHHLLDTLYIGGRVIEPCYGQGHIGKALQQHTPWIEKVTANDIDLASPAPWHYDAADPGSGLWEIQTHEWVITNPPFSQAFDILQNAWEHATLGVALLLRLSFLEPTRGREAWMKEHQKHLSHLLIFGSPRPDFTGNGGDSVTTAWMVWEKRPDHKNTEVRFVTHWK